jgi:hypothetical protein
MMGKVEEWRLVYGCNINFFNPFEVYFNMTVMGFVLKFTDYFKDIIINKPAFATINSEYGVFGYLLQSIPQLYFIQEGDIPMLTPISRSVKRMMTIVIRKGRNCFGPRLHM